MEVALGSPRALARCAGGRAVFVVAAVAASTTAVWITAASARRHRLRRAAARPDASPSDDRSSAPDGASVVTLDVAETLDCTDAVGFASEPGVRGGAGMIRELSASRARIVAAADRERRRIEQDLHDGAQQRLVALRIHIEQIAERVAIDGAAEAEALHALGAEVDEALQDIRRLTRGIYPTVLTDRGVSDALRALAMRSPVATRVEDTGVGTYSAEIAAAVYFCCAEALQNVAKHALDATQVTIRLAEERSVLRFSVLDDGPGMSLQDARVGAGIINMEDRIATVGGRLVLRSSPGEGVHLIGRIPLAAA